MPTAIEYFLKIDGIEGESTSVKHRGEIDVLSWSWGETQSGTAAHGGAGAGKVSMHDLHFTKHTDKASPTLLLAVASGKHFHKAVLTASRKVGDGTQDFLKLTFTDLLFSSFEIGGNTTAPDPAPTDQVSFNFRRIDMQVGAGGANTAGFDFLK
jgi:type VI secretion system secreted protein Hcp